MSFTVGTFGVYAVVIITLYDVGSLAQPVVVAVIVVPTLPLPERETDPPDGTVAGGVCKI